MELQMIIIIIMGVIMDAMRMNPSYAGECSIVDEELNVDAIIFFELLNDLTNHYEIGTQIITN
jgi:hypothetical protein